MPHWDHLAPIYRQLADHLAARLLDGEIVEGAAMPSVRQLASQFMINPMTVSRALQALDAEGLLENRRGLGLYVRAGARQKLREAARERFLAEEWPQLRARLRRLELKPGDLSWEQP